ncbi:MAG: protoporphyrinogen oxidase, partial [Naasia sp.]
ERFSRLGFFDTTFGVRVLDEGGGSLFDATLGFEVFDCVTVREGVDGVEPDDIDADALAPGLTAALARAGSLAGAVATLRGSAPAGAAVTGIAGGVHLLASALADDVAERGVEVVTGARVQHLVQDGGGWRLEHDDGAIDGEQVVVATGGAAARALIAPLVDDELIAGWPAGRTTTVVAVTLDDPRLDSAARGTGVLVAHPEAGTASALTHSSAKWPWLRDMLPAGRHIVRLTYRGAWRDLPDERVLADAYRLLGIEPTGSALVARADAVWEQDAPRAIRGVETRLARLAAETGGIPGLSLTGAWIAGTGLAAVIEHADGVRVT